VSLQVLVPFYFHSQLRVQFISSTFAPTPRASFTTVTRQSRHPNNLLYSSRATLESNSRNTNPAPQHRYEDSEPELEEGSDDDEEAEESASASDDEDEEEEEEATKAPGMTSTFNSPNPTPDPSPIISSHIVYLFLATR
jgi:hypothetical protein